MKSRLQEQKPKVTNLFHNGGTAGPNLLPPH